MGRKYVIYIIAVLTSALFLITPDNAGASGGIAGDGGTSTSPATGGGASTRNGWGWYQYKLGSSRNAVPSHWPAGARNGNNVNTIHQQCYDIGATHLVAFIIQNKSSGDGQNGIIYRYQSAKGVYFSPQLTGYKGNKGKVNNSGTWLTLNQANSRFNDYLDQTAPNTKDKFGQNIAWFCWSKSQWSLSTSSFISRSNGSWGSAGRTISVKRGETIYFKHDIKNSGNVQASYNRWLRTKYNANDYSFNSSTYPISSKLASGGTASYPGSESARRYTIPNNAPAGALYCQSYTVKNRSSTNSDNLRSTGACARVDHWDLSVSSYVSKSNGSWGSAARTIEAKPGTAVYYRHEVSNSGNVKAQFSRWLKTARNTSNYTHTSTYPLAGNINAKSSFSYPAAEADRRYVIPNNAPAGALYCERYEVKGRSTTNSNSLTSSQACVRVVPNALDWEVDPDINARYNSSTNSLGSITWTYNIKNSGKDKTNKKITYKLVAQNNATSGALDGDRVVEANAGLNGGASTSNRTYTFSELTQNDVGKSICRFVRASPASSSDNGTVTAQACATVPYNYVLTPNSPNVNTSQFVPGGTINRNIVTGTISNSGPTKSHDNTIRILTGYIARKGVSVPTSAVTNNANRPNVYYTSGAGRESLGEWDTTGSIGTGGASQTNIDNVELPSNLEVGDRVCFATSVSPSRNNQTGRWSHSVPTCITIAKKPKTEIVGGNLVVGQSSNSSSGVVTGSISGVNGRDYGSSVEYGIIARGLVTGVSSAQGYKDGRTGVSYCGLSFLTFGNSSSSSSACVDNQVGQFTGFGGASAITGSFPVTGGTLSGTRDVSSLSSGVYTINGTGTLNINANDDIAKGRSVIINAPNANIRITGDIAYTSDELNSLSEIPQLVIIANNIYINESVNRVDAWLIAEGSSGIVNTCARGTTNLDTMTGINSENCNEPLRVNGPVLANRLLLKRTSGSTSTDPGEPAEVFNLRPDSYLWAMNRANLGVRLPTALTKELPPRY